MVWKKILKESLSYPSPHNSQPIRVRIINDSTLEVYYDKNLGLPAESLGISFGYVCAGIFFEIVAIIAHTMQFEVEEDIVTENMDFTSNDNLHLLGTLRLHESPDVKEQFSLEDLRIRQTSRLPYQKRKIESDVLDSIDKEVERFGYMFHIEEREHMVHEIIRLNQRTLFYDLEDKNTRDEIKGYLRYSKKEAMTRADGLSAECLGVPGILLKFFMAYPEIWNVPVVGTIMRAIYLRSMSGVSQVGWLTGPFSCNTEYIRAGRCFIRAWLLFTQHDVYIHPFGSVITNESAHREFCDIVGEQEEGDNVMAWMLFRFGYSDTPPRSMRRKIDTMIIS